jgi:hypothetical protein
MQGMVRMAEPDVMVYPDSGKVGIFGVRAVVEMFADGPSMGDPYPPWASFSAPKCSLQGSPLLSRSVGPPQSSLAPRGSII